MSEWVPLYYDPVVEHRRRITVLELKQQLRDLGWTCKSSDAERDHGPQHSRLEAEQLFAQWRTVENPYNL